LASNSAINSILDLSHNDPKRFCHRDQLTLGARLKFIHTRPTSSQRILTHIYLFGQDAHILYIYISPQNTQAQTCAHTHLNWLPNHTPALNHWPSKLKDMSSESGYHKRVLEQTGTVYPHPLSTSATLHSTL
jgi:hypothetical protein